ARRRPLPGRRHRRRGARRDDRGGGRPRDAPAGPALSPGRATPRFTAVTWFGRLGGAVGGVCMCHLQIPDTSATPRHPPVTPAGSPSPVPGTGTTADRRRECTRRWRGTPHIVTNP